MICPAFTKTAEISASKGTSSSVLTTLKCEKTFLACSTL
jgi:hypothetical protein